MISPPVASLAELREVRGGGGSELVAELGCGEQRQERLPCRQRNIILAYSLVQRFPPSCSTSHSKILRLSGRKGARAPGARHNLILVYTENPYRDSK